MSGPMCRTSLILPQSWICVRTPAWNARVAGTDCDFLLCTLSLGFTRNGEWMLWLIVNSQCSYLRQSIYSDLLWVLPKADACLWSAGSCVLLTQDWACLPYWSGSLEIWWSSRRFKTSKESMGLSCHGRGKRCHLSNKSSVLSSF